MERKIIHIDEEKCNGCGACAAACHEGAIGMIDGKAKLLRDDYCDGMGDCLPECPTGAITFEVREAAAYDEAAVLANKQGRTRRQDMAPHKEPEPHPGHPNHHPQHPAPHPEGGCPGSRIRQMNRNPQAGSHGYENPGMDGRRPDGPSGRPGPAAPFPGPAAPFPGPAPTSQLSNWPVQIKLAPLHAPYFNGAKLLIAADCTAYAYANFHQELIRGKITLVGCPKLDSVDYSEKLTEIIAGNDIKSVTIVRMEVPCCGGLEMAVKKALQASGKFIPWQVVTISIDGNILE